LYKDLVTTVTLSCLFTGW